MNCSHPTPSAVTHPPSLVSRSYSRDRIGQKLAKRHEGERDRKYSRFALPRHLAFELRLSRELAVGVPPVPSLVKVLFPHGIEHGAEFSCEPIETSRAQVDMSKE